MILIDCILHVLFSKRWWCSIWEDKMVSGSFLPIHIFTKNLIHRHTGGFGDPNTLWWLGSVTLQAFSRHSLSLTYRVICFQDWYFLINQNDIWFNSLISRWSDRCNTNICHVKSESWQICPLWWSYMNKTELYIWNKDIWVAACSATVWLTTYNILLIYNIYTFSQSIQWVCVQTFDWYCILQHFQ